LFLITLLHASTNTDRLMMKACGSQRQLQGSKELGAAAPTPWESGQAGDQDRPRNSSSKASRRAGGVLQSGRRKGQPLTYKINRQII
jgi:hypothetical protein